MRKLAEQLKKIDIELPKWTRDVLFEHNASPGQVSGLIVGPLVLRDE